MTQNINITEAIDYGGGGGTIFMPNGVDTGNSLTVPSGQHMVARNDFYVDGDFIVDGDFFGI